MTKNLEQKFINILRNLPYDSPDGVSCTSIGSALKWFGIDYRKMGYPKLRDFLMEFDNILSITEEPGSYSKTFYVKFKKSPQVKVHVQNHGSQANLTPNDNDSYNHDSINNRSNNYRANNNQSGGYRMNDNQFNNYRANNNQSSSYRMNDNQFNDYRANNNQSSSYRMNDNQFNNYRANNNQSSSYRMNDNQFNNYRSNNNQSGGYRMNDNQSNNYRANNNQSGGYRMNDNQFNDYRANNNQSGGYRMNDNQFNDYRANNNQSGGYRMNNDQSDAFRSSSTRKLSDDREHIENSIIETMMILGTRYPLGVNVNDLSHELKSLKNVDFRDYGFQRFSEFLNQFKHTVYYTAETVLGNNGSRTEYYAHLNSDAAKNYCSSLSPAEKEFLLKCMVNQAF